MLYDDKGFQVANSIDRFAASSWMPFQYNPDGSLALCFQHESPGKEKEWNWLPTPEGPYTLTMRLYAPKPDVLTEAGCANGKAESAAGHEAAAASALPAQ
jgi:hypothetical protein